MNLQLKRLNPRRKKFHMLNKSVLIIFMPVNKYDNIHQKRIENMGKAKQCR